MGMRKTVESFGLEERKSRFLTTGDTGYGKA